MPGPLTHPTAPGSIRRRGVARAGLGQLPPAGFITCGIELFFQLKFINALIKLLKILYFILLLCLAVYEVPAPFG